MCILAVASLPTSAHNLAGLHTLVSSLALYITTLSSSLLLRQVRCRWLFISDVSLIKLLNCLRLNCHREDLRKLANTNCYVSFIYRVGTVHKTYRFFIFPFADAQPPRHSLSLLSSSSLPFQLINFLFRHLSPVSSIAPFLYSHLMPFLPISSLCVILTLTQLPIFMFLASKHPWKAFSLSQHCSSHENRPTDICLFPPRLQFCPFFSLRFLPPFSYLLSSATSYLSISSAQEVIVMYVSAPHQELFLGPILSSSLLVLRIEVWVPSHLGGGAAQSGVPWKRSVGCVPDTERLSMHRMRSQTRWSVMGVRVKWVVCVCVWLYMSLSFLCVCVRAHACTCVFAHACVSVGEKKKDWQWCFRGHAYGGLAVMHGCG